ncbi:MAG: serine/threonine-protein kinase [Acidobacteriota bacterium]|nr:serine/threonine-protein kinase [Acidobacteriota bacterium]
MAADAERRAHLDRLLVELLDSPAADRTARLESVDPALRAELESLLAAALDEDSVLRPGGALRPDLLREAAGEPDGEHGGEPDASGRVVGAYRLLEPIGRGGMGTVYLAERADGRFERRVAVKLLHLGDAVADRRGFEREQQILAGLEHPGIARLFDGGVGPDGEPYFVMELVDGEPIDGYCDGHRLSVARRMDLLIEVCRAVEAAHRQLIVHRDLKPSNLLVDREGRPRLLDFGIAGTLDTEEAKGERVADGSERLTAGRRRMTPLYASPEQRRGERVGVASDIYQLGLLVDALIAGRSPQQPAPRQTETQPLDARPVSQRLRRTKIAVKDFEAVVAKALAPAPRDRYASVRELRQDLERLRDGHPVAARPASRSYRLLRLVGRHPWTSAATVGAAALLVVVVATFTWRLAEERNATREQARRAEETLRFVTELFRRAGPERGSGPDTTAREMLDHGVRSIRGRLEDRPLLKARILSEIGSMYEVLGLWDAAEELLLEGLELRTGAGRRDGGKEGVEKDLADSWFRLGRLDSARGDLASASSRLERALSYSARAPIAGALGTVRRRQGRLDEAGDLHRRALALYEAAGDRQGVLGEQVNLAIVLARQGRRAEARRLLEESAAGLEQLTGPEHVSLGVAFGSLAALDVRAGAPEKALPLFERSLAILEAAYGREHARVAQAAMNLGNVTSRLGRHREARLYMQRALEIYRALDHPDRGAALMNLGVLEKRLGELEAAEDAYGEALALLRQRGSGGRREIALALYNLGEVVAAQGRVEPALELLLESRDLFVAELGRDHLLVSYPLLELARLRAGQGDSAAAEALFERAVAIRRGAEGVDPAVVTEAAQALEAFRSGDS